MKVLSVQEPYASLIAKGLKSIETRSWKTNYRGEILIHASLSKNFLKSINDFEVIEMIKNTEMMFGKIVCFATLVDCIFMDENFVNKVKENHIEYILGIYEVGRYAWLLENVRVLEKPFDVKGKLNLWEYDMKDNLETEIHSGIFHLIIS